MSAAASLAPPGSQALSLPGPSGAIFQGVRHPAGLPRAVPGRPDAGLKSAISRTRDPPRRPSREDRAHSTPAPSTWRGVRTTRTRAPPPPMGSADPTQPRPLDRSSDTLDPPRYRATRGRPDPAPDRSAPADERRQAEPARPLDRSSTPTDPGRPQTTPDDDRPLLPGRERAPLGVGSVPVDIKRSDAARKTCPQGPIAVGQDRSADRTPRCRMGDDRPDRTPMREAMG